VGLPPRRHRTPWRARHPFGVNARAMRFAPDIRRTAERRTAP
jgi:hypothetical protein